MMIRRTLQSAAAGVIALALAVGGASAQEGPPAAAASQAPGASQEAPKIKRLLIWADVQTGWHHDSMNRAMAAVELMGRESGLWVSYIRTDSQMITREPILGQGARYGGRRINALNLNDFDAIFFLGSGEGTLTDAQKADLLAFVHEDGKGFIGGHASTIGFYDWPEFGQMLGGVMAGEFRVEPHALVVEDPAFPAAATFPSEFADQYQYLDETFDQGAVHTILRLDPEALTPEQRARRPDDNFPVVWAKPYGAGRVFVSTFGHLDEPWAEPGVQALYLEGIRWALGLNDAAISFKSNSETETPRAH